MDEAPLSIVVTEEDVRTQKFLRDFATACRKMSPLVGFTTRAFLIGGAEADCTALGTAHRSVD